MKRHEVRILDRPARSILI